MIQRKIKSHLKEFIYSYSWILLLLACVFLFVRAKSYCSNPSIIASVLGVYYFIHKQKLSETSFFLEQFKAFNQRYDELNDVLSLALKNKNFSEVKDKVVDYFNLCAEEYLIYQKGYIPNNVWKAWANGMKVYWQNEEFRKIWESEDPSSYYGFKFEDL